MRRISIALLCIAITSCYTSRAQIDTKSNNLEIENGLKDFYKDFFSIGVSVSSQSLTTNEKLITKHFSSLTPENAMKMGPIHPEENRYAWEAADNIVNFAQKHKIKIRGHALCWHNQTPKWLFVNAIGDTVSKEVLLKRLKDHITAVVTRYKGKIYAWDVVNEVIDDNNSKFLRASPWYKICREDFIIKAFEYAHEADPNALLFYNDYDTEKPGKRDRVYELVKKLLDKKVPIHGIGLQTHISIYEPSEKNLRESIQKFSSLGLQVQITELDVSVYKSESSSRERKNDDPIDTFTSEMEQKQVEQYKMIFNVFRDYKDIITGVTFWNVSDKHSWLDDFPVQGRKNYPLLFDKNQNPKKAYWEVVKF